MVRGPWRAYLLAAVATLGYLAPAGCPEALQERTRIAVISPHTPENARPLMASLMEGLSQFGLHDGNNLSVDFRFAAGKLEEVPHLVAASLEKRPHVLVVGGTTP